MPPHVSVNPIADDVHQSGGQVKVLPKRQTESRKTSVCSAHAWMRARGLLLFRAWRHHARGVCGAHCVSSRYDPTVREENKDAVLSREDHGKGFLSTASLAFDIGTRSSENIIDM